MPSPEHNIAPIKAFNYIRDRVGFPYVLGVTVTLTLGSALLYEPDQKPVESIPKEQAINPDGQTQNYATPSSPGYRFYLPPIK